MHQNQSGKDWEKQIYIFKISSKTYGNSKIKNLIDSIGGGVTRGLFPVGTNDEEFAAILGLYYNYKTKTNNN